MTPDGLAVLTMVGQFLAREILPAVPPALAGELRAAIKILDTAAEELNALHPLLRRECRELLQLGHAACAILRASGNDQPLGGQLTDLAACLADDALDTRGLLGLHARILDESSTAIASLQRRIAATAEADLAARTLLTSYYGLLERQALARLRWQSVFARPLTGEVTD